MSQLRLPIRLIFAVGLLLLTGCESDDRSIAPSGDSRSPSAVADLAITVVSDHQVSLSWVAPGDDGGEGQATHYDIRYLEGDLDEANWALATRTSTATVPQVSGETEVALIPGLERGTWFFGLKTADEVLNWSSLSNIVVATVGDSIPPAAIEDLLAEKGDREEIILSWTAPGDDGDVGQSEAYDLRVAKEPVTEANWADAASISGPSIPGTAGVHETTSTDLPLGATYHFAIRTRDNGANLSSLSNVAVLVVPPDTSAPDIISDLSSHDVTAQTVILDWRSPDEEGALGRASSYDIRFSEEEIREETWLTSTPVEGLGPPKRPGVLESVTVMGLEPKTDYYFAIKAADEIPNWSAISNVLSVRTESSWPLLAEENEASAMRHPSWSPDGGRLAISADVSDQTDIYTISPTGRDLIQLTNTASTTLHPTWSPLGDKIAFVSWDDGSASLWTVDVDQSSPPILLVDVGLAGMGRPTWSPDGARVAYASPSPTTAQQRSNIMVVESDGGAPEVLIAGGSRWGYSHPAWAPQGDRMAVSSSQGATSTLDIYIAWLSGSSVVRVTGWDRAANDIDPAWSPDGTELVYATDEDQIVTLRRVRATGGGAETLRLEAYASANPAWSAEGHFVAFTRKDFRQEEVWIHLLD